MNKEYPFWKLLRAQWSWKNDRVMIILNLITSLFINCVHLLFGEVTYTETGLPVEGFDLTILILISTTVLGIFMTVMYQIIKLILFTMYCYLVCYSLKDKFSEDKSYSEHKALYEEMLTWRQ